jgi:hypothetical protein
MGVFGPQYSQELQDVINHAERFCELLAQRERLDGVRASTGHGWLIGRRQEVEAVLELIVRDFASDRIGLEQATRAAASYLDELHAGAEQRLGLGPLLECCGKGESLTASVARAEEAITRPLPEKRLAAEACETWFDPSALLEVREPPSAGPEDETRAGASAEPVGQEAGMKGPMGPVGRKGGAEPRERGDRCASWVR